ncbi:dihydroxy-acid dehydratase [Salipiger abyssi]|uniref:dihydroxy-acid dehydratase n=1 Tax=Salipiger abyssi TaxID=1250539 RepID=UPI001F450765|nr:dihydroxy-acid dehydratase [Salipiger abyssi]
MKRGTGLAGLIALVSLAGCVQAPSGADTPDEAGEPATGGFFATLFPTGAAAAPERPTPLAQTEMARGEVVVAGPEGYCVDPVTLGNRPGRGFAVIASCHILSGGKTGNFVEPMMMTVTVGPRQQTVVPPAPSVLAVQAGQELVGGEVRDGLVMAQLGGGGTDVLDDGDPRYWRGAFVQNGHLIGLALYAPQGSFLAGPDGAGMLRAVQQRIVSLSPAAAEDEEAPVEP